LPPARAPAARYGAASGARSHPRPRRGRPAPVADLVRGRVRDRRGLAVPGVDGVRVAVAGVGGDEEDGPPRRALAFVPGREVRGPGRQPREDRVPA
ncbi:hypothetical protein ACFWAO_28825, partial [Streptomyces sp. NPDC059981]